MSQTARRLALAFVIGTVAVLLIDVVLHIALGVVRDSATAAPWWVNARVIERAVSVIAALLLWWVAPVVAAVVDVPEAPQRVDVDLSLAAATRLVGGGMVIVPVTWSAATVMVFAARVTFAGDWRTDAVLLLEPYYYSDLVLANAPWMLGGAALVVLARHLPHD